MLFARLPGELTLSIRLPGEQVLGLFGHLFSIWTFVDITVPKWRLATQPGLFVSQRKDLKLFKQSDPKPIFKQSDPTPLSFNDLDLLNSKGVLYNSNSKCTFQLFPSKSLKFDVAIKEVKVTPGSSFTCI